MMLHSSNPHSIPADYLNTKYQQLAASINENSQETPTQQPSCHSNQQIVESYIQNDLKLMQEFSK
jgi:hypothetical protein